MAVNVNGGALEFDAVINASQFNAAISAIERQLAGLTNTAQKEASAIDNVVRKTATAIAAYASFSAGSNFVGDIVRVRGEFQQLEVAFTTMLQSKQKADKLLAEITQFAATTPFELKDVASATKQLLAFGISAEKIEPTLRALGDVSAGIGAPLGEIAYLFGTIKTQGVALTQDVRQFAQRGIPIYEELAKVLGVSTDQVGEFITAGKVGFPEIEKVFQNLTAEGSKFGGLMEAQSKTLVGLQSNLRDAVDQMLNDLGRSSEGLFADVIKGATVLVQNYEKVLDVLKVLVITYGSYKAAVIATTAVQGLATAATKGYTIAEMLRYRAMLLSEGAMKLLNKTMLANPFVAVATGVAALVAALVIFQKETTKAKSAQQLLSDAQEQFGGRLAETEAKIRPYLEQLRNANVSEQDRLNIYNKLKEIDPKIVEGLTAKTISYEKLANNVNLYLTALRKQIALEVNRSAVTESIKEEERLQKELDQERKNLEINIRERGDDDAYVNNVQLVQIEKLKTQLKEQKAETEELGNTQVEKEKQVSAEKERTLRVIEDEIKSLKEQQTASSTTAKQYQEYQKQINKLEQEKRRITGASKSEAAAANKAIKEEESEINALLEKRKDLLGQIADQQRNADRSGLTKEQTELDRINERYDTVLQNITEYNKRVDEFNKKNPKAGVQKVGQADILALNDARSQELDNSTLRQKAEEYKKYLEAQRQLFIEYENAKNEVGLQKAKELFGAQLGNYDNFLQLLQQQAAQLLPKIQLGIANVGEVEKFKALIDQIQQYNKDKTKEELENEKQKFISLLEASATYNQQKAAINQKYDELEATLRANSTIAEFDERKKILDTARQEELDALNSQMARSTALYRKLNQDILLFTRERIKAEVKLLREKLKTDTALSPQQKADIENTINQYESLLNETNELAKDFSRISIGLSEVAGIFGDLGSALEGVNDGLADTLNTISQIANIGSNAAGAIASFAVGDIVGGIKATVGVITGIINIGKQARESRKQAEREIEAFQQRVLQGEIQITQELRNRQREQVKLNKLKLEGLKAERELLEAQKQAIQQQYQSLLSQLQQQSFIVGQTTEKYGGFLGIGRKTRVVDITQSLAGKSFEELEKLFAEGRLTGKALELFELLRQIKQEGVDIDQLLADNAEAANQIFTGTTADSIVDAIADGFANGKRSIRDFAGDFEDLMRQAIINSLKYQYLEEPLREFYEQFAAASQSDNALTEAEIEQLRQLYSSIINNAQAQFNQLQQISGLNLAASGSTSNSLSGAIKGITEQQADLLAGQFGGLRITALEHLAVGRRSLEHFNQIQINTSLTALRTQTVIDKLIYYYEVRGVKIL